MKLRSVEKNRVDPWFTRYVFLSRAKTLWFLYLGVFGICLVQILAVGLGEGLSIGLAHCFQDILFTQAIWAGLLLISAIFFIYRLYHSKDAYYLLRELQVFIVLFPFTFVAAIILFNLSDQQAIAIDIVMIAMIITFSISLYYPFVLSFQKRWNLNTTLASMKTKNQSRITLDDIFVKFLTEPILLKEFQQYCVELWCVENLQFYQEVQNFKNTFGEDSSSKAKRIIDLYIDPRGEYRVNIDYKISRDLMETYNEGNGNVDVHCFDKAEKAVLLQMNHDTFTKFKISGKLEKAWKAAGYDLEEIGMSS